MKTYVNVSCRRFGSRLIFPVGRGIARHSAANPRSLRPFPVPMATAADWMKIVLILHTYVARRLTFVLSSKNDSSLPIVYTKIKLKKNLPLSTLAKINGETSSFWNIFVSQHDVRNYRPFGTNILLIRKLLKYRCVNKIISERFHRRQKLHTPLTISYYENPLLPRSPICALINLILSNRTDFPLCNRSIWNGYRPTFYTTWCRLVKIKISSTIIFYK